MKSRVAQTVSHFDRGVEAIVVGYDKCIRFVPDAVKKMRDQLKIQRVAGAVVSADQLDLGPGGVEPDHRLKFNGVGLITVEKEDLISLFQCLDTVYSLAFYVLIINIKICHMLSLLL
ncbi:MAG TPA: hypothetical protein DEP00_07180 [Lachnospiraceae bacterium]|nr:hypothetical protein [Lachnospiraceae bacterium]